MEHLEFLPNNELDRAYELAQLALQEAIEAVKDIEDERFQRWYATHVLREKS